VKKIIFFLILLFFISGCVQQQNNNNISQQTSKYPKDFYQNTNNNTPVDTPSKFKNNATDMENKLNDLGVELNNLMDLNNMSLDTQEEIELNTKHLSKDSFESDL